jgi:DNA-binding response OmpR family regulator
MKKKVEGTEQAVILIVEDDPPTLFAYRDILEGSAFQVLTAANGEEALDLFLKETPDLILSGIHMPVMDGIELLKAIRETSQGKITPFIFQTARGSREDIFSGKLLGADDYISKPLTSKELLISVQALLKRFNELKEGWL